MNSDHLTVLLIESDLFWSDEYILIVTNACLRVNPRVGHYTQCGGNEAFFPSLTRILAECSAIYSPLAFFFFFFSEVDSTLRTLIPLFVPGSVHGGSAS